MKRNRTGLPRLVDSAAENLAPAYFALVMATGAVSLAAQAVDYSFLARSPTGSGHGSPTPAWYIFCC